MLSRAGGGFVRMGGEDADVPNGPGSSRGIAVCRNGAFPGKCCQACSLLPPHTAQELSLSADRHGLLARQAFRTWSWWHCQLLSWVPTFLRTDKFGLGSRVWHRALLLCCWPDILGFPHLKTNVLAANLVLSQTLLSKYLHLVLDKPFPKQGCKVYTSIQMYSIQNYVTVVLPYAK